jgi:hypothetical protein
MRRTELRSLSPVDLLDKIAQRDPAREGPELDTSGPLAIQLLHDAELALEGAGQDLHARSLVNHGDHMGQDESRDIRGEAAYTDRTSPASPVRA